MDNKKNKKVKKMDNKYTKLRRNVFRKYIYIFVGVAIFLIAFGSVFQFYNMTGPGYLFNREVHGHMENAYYADEPILMRNELSYAINGMYELGLTKDMYGAFWSWDKTPDKKMDYQYNHLDAVIVRIDAVIEWREKTYANGSTSTEQLGDVFEQKMSNLRTFLKKGGWSDWIANDAFYINNYLFLYIFPYAIIPVILLYFFIMLYYIVQLMRSEGYQFFDESNKRWKWEIRKDWW